MNIQLIRPLAIDKEKYDNCIQNALNGSVYAMSWYLDTVAPGWQLLATPDYSFVMPLPIKKKCGISYLLQPLLCQQLGIFSGEKIPESVFKLFVKKIPAVFCSLNLNRGNLFQCDDLKWKANYVLDIRSDYEKIKKQYHRNTRSDLKKTMQISFQWDTQVDYSVVIDMVEKHSQNYAGKVLNMAKQITKKINEKGLLTVRCIRDEKTSEILAGVLFFQWQNRFYYMIPCSTHQGKKVRAMRFLVDHFIAEWAGQNYILDFEGSSIPSVAQFYQNFGAALEPYPVYDKKPAIIEWWLSLR
jgi:hypothetical protein